MMVDRELCGMENGIEIARYNGTRDVDDRGTQKSDDGRCGNQTVAERVWSPYQDSWIDGGHLGKVDCGVGENVDPGNVGGQETLYGKI